MPSEPKKHAFRRVDSGGDVCRWCGDPFQPGHLQDNTGDVMPSEELWDEVRWLSDSQGVVTDDAGYSWRAVDSASSEEMLAERALRAEASTPSEPTSEELLAPLLRGWHPSVQSEIRGLVQVLIDHEVTKERARYEAVVEAARDVRGKLRVQTSANAYRMIHERHLRQLDAALAALREERPVA